MSKEQVQVVEFIDKEKIQQRIKQLETEREQTRINLVAYEGAIQDCNYWLKELEKPVEEENKE